jgi:hypothetical protein
MDVGVVDGVLGDTPTPGRVPVVAAVPGTHVSPTEVVSAGQATEAT